MEMAAATRVISNREVVGMYRRLVKANNNLAYLGKYRDLPRHLYAGKKWEGMDLGRAFSLLEFKEYSEKYGGFKVDKALVLNGDNDPELRWIEAGRVDHVAYDPETETNDLHTLNLPEKGYGFAMANQTLEHLYNPHLCLQNVRAHLAPGGYFYANVPALNIPHSEPFHYYTGLTPMGLAALLHAAGFEVLEVGQWGNCEYIERMYREHTWPDYVGFTNYANEFENPVATWALAIRR